VRRFLKNFQQLSITQLALLNIRRIALPAFRWLDELVQTESSSIAAMKLEIREILNRKLDGKALPVASSKVRLASFVGETRKYLSKESGNLAVGKYHLERQAVYLSQSLSREAKDLEAQSLSLQAVRKKIDSFVASRWSALSRTLAIEFGPSVNGEDFVAFFAVCFEITTDRDVKRQVVSLMHENSNYLSAAFDRVQSNIFSETRALDEEGELLKLVNFCRAYHHKKPLSKSSWRETRFDLYSRNRAVPAWVFSQPGLSDLRSQPLYVLAGSLLERNAFKVAFGLTVHLIPETVDSGWKDNPRYIPPTGGGMGTRGYNLGRESG